MGEKSMKHVALIAAVVVGIIILSPILLLLCLLLLIPLKYKLFVESNEEKIVADFRISYLFGLIRKSYGYNSAEVQDEEPEKKKKKKKKEEKDERGKDDKSEKRGKKESDAKTEKAKKRDKFKLPLTLKRGKTIIRLAFTALKKYIRLLAPSRLTVTGTFSLGCPANTAFAQGAFEIVAAFCRGRARRRKYRGRYSINIAGDYLADDAHFTGEALVSGKITPLRLLGPALWLVSRKEIRTEICNYLRKDD
jgi:hypothetical protein